MQLQTKATDTVLSCSVVLYVVCNLVLIFESVVKILTCENSNETTEATEQYFLVVMFIMLYKVVLTFESVGEIMKCDHSNKSY